MPAIDLNGTRFEYTDCGRGEPVIALHCSGSSGGQWRRLTDALADRYRVLAPDLHGSGRTAPWRGHRPITLADEVEIVGALLEVCGGAAHLVGHSFGGAVALHAARRHATRVRSLALIEPVAFHLLRDGDGRDAAALREISDVAEMVWRAVSSGDSLAGFGRFVDYWSGPGSWAAVPEARHAAMAAALGSVALNFWAALSEPTRAGHFADVDLPTLVIAGERSPLAGRRVAGRVAEVLPNARLVTLKSAGHMAPVTHAEAVNALIGAHLDAHAAHVGSPHRQARSAQPQAIEA